MANYTDIGFLAALPQLPAEMRTEEGLPDLSKLLAPDQYEPLRLVVLNSIYLENQLSRRLASATIEMTVGTDVEDVIVRKGKVIMRIQTAEGNPPVTDDVYVCDVPEDYQAIESHSYWLTDFLSEQ